MTPELEEQIREIIREEMNSTFAHTFERHLQLLDGRNIQVGKTTGTMIGTEGGATGQKLAVLGATPVVQASAISAPSSPGGVYSQSEAQSAVTAINSLRTAIKNFGITA